MFEDNEASEWVLTNNCVFSIEDNCHSGKDFDSLQEEKNQNLISYVESLQSGVKRSSGSLSEDSDSEYSCKRLKNASDFSGGTPISDCCFESSWQTKTKLYCRLSPGAELSFETKTKEKAQEQSPSNEKYVSSLEFTKHLGNGTFGKISRVRDPESGKEMALKELSIFKTDEDNFVKEVDMLKITSEKSSFLKFFGSFQFDDRYVILMEYFDGFTVAHLISNYFVPFKAFHFMAHEMAVGLSQLVSLNIIHGDLKPNNILLNIFTNKIKIIDFGMASTGPTTEGLRGTMSYMAPEIARNMLRYMRRIRPYGYEVDVYSYGAICMKMYVGTTPYQLIKSKGMQREKIVRGIVDGNFPFPTVGDFCRNAPFPVDDAEKKNFGKALCFLKRMLHPIRPRPSDILMLKFFDGSLLSEVKSSKIADYINKRTSGK